MSDEELKESRPLRYLLLSEHYLPEIGGHIVLLHETCRRLGNTTVVAGNPGGLPKTEVIDGVKIDRVSLSRFSFLRPESLFTYGSLLLSGLHAALRYRPDVLLAARVLPEGLVAWVISKLLRMPFVTFAYGEEIASWGRAGSQSKRRALTGALKRRCLWSVYHASDSIVAISRFTHDLLANRRVDSGKLKIIHPGTDPEVFKPMAKDRAMVQDLDIAGKKVLLTVGRLTERKGQDMTFRAMKRILKEVPDVVYVIAGTGVYERELKKLAHELDIESNVRFTGEVSQESLPKLYNLCDVFLMPNRVLGGKDVEGFGIVFLEASASGKPVIGGMSGGVPDALVDGETGLLVDGSVPSEIATAAIRLLTDPDLADKFGRAGRERVCRELTWDNTAGGVSEFVKKTIGARSRYRNSVKKRK